MIRKPVCSTLGSSHFQSVKVELRQKKFEKASCEVWLAVWCGLWGV